MSNVQAWLGWVDLWSTYIIAEAGGDSTKAAPALPPRFGKERCGFDRWVPFIPLSVCPLPIRLSSANNVAELSIVVRLVCMIPPLICESHVSNG